MSVQTERQAGPLPRGRHRLSRAEVESSQYRRLCVAALTAVGELGYAATTVADIVGRARVARRTFYAMFSGKEQCFTAAYDFGVELAMRRLVDGVDGPGVHTFPDRVRALFDTYLAVLAAQPAATRALYVETLVAGGPLLEHRARVHRQFATYILGVAQVGVATGDLSVEPELEVIDMLLGGIDDRIRACLHERGAEALPQLAPLFTRTALALCEAAPMIVSR